MKQVVLSVVILLTATSLFGQGNSRANTPTASNPNRVAEESSFSQQYRQLAYRACNTIERIPVLEQSQLIYDNRLAEAEKALDELELNTKSPKEKQATDRILLEFIQRKRYRRELDLAMLKEDVNRARFSSLGISSTSPTAQLRALEGQERISKKAEEIAATSLASSKRLLNIAEAIKNGTDIPAADSSNQPIGLSSEPTRDPKAAEGGDKITPPTILSKVDPQYPDVARSARIQGMVVLEVLVKRDGTVDVLSVISGSPLLKENAIQAVKQWRYTPGMQNGTPVDVRLSVSVDFNLKK